MTLQADPCGTAVLLAEGSDEEEWVLRRNALHAKSKTYRRVDFLEPNRQ